MERADFKITTPKWIINESICRYEFASKFVKGKIVVDAACGTGYGEKILLKKKPKKILAFDISEEAILKFKTEHKDMDKNKINFQVADITNLPLKNKMADVFVSLETIEHLKKVDKYLIEVKRVLKDNGIFICSTPNRRVTNPGLSFKGKPFNHFHLFEFSKKEFLKKMENNFQTVNLYGQNFNSKKMIKFFNKLALLSSPNIAIKLRQFIKLPRLLFDLKKQHHVKITKNNREPEYLIAVCYNYLISKKGEK